MQKFDFLEIDQMGPVATVTISRLEAMNSLNPSVLKSLRQMCEWAEGESDVKALVLTGAGEKAFVAGADIKQFEAMTSEQATEFSRFGQELFLGIERMSVPVIAAVNGFALGGGLELALACDFIYASETARFALPECTLGLIPGFGGTVRLPRRIGAAMAKEITLTGSMISAQQALQMGLVNRVLPQAELLRECIKTANVLAERAPLALERIKKSIHYGASLSDVAANELEAELFSELFATQDQREGQRAFVEKRKPVFKGI